MPPNITGCGRADIYGKSKFMGGAEWGAACPGCRWEGPMRQSVAEAHVDLKNHKAGVSIEPIRLPYTAEEFERDYAEQSCVPVQYLRDMGRVIVPCDCKYPDCRGWQSVNAVDKHTRMVIEHKPQPYTIRYGDQEG